MRVRLRRRRLLFASLAAWLCAACAQVGPASAPPPRAGDPLGWLIGSWRGTRLEPSSGERAPVVSEIAAVLGGAGEEETLEIRTSNGLYHGIYLQVADPETGKSVITYVNSTRRAFVRLEGTAGPAGGEWRNVAAQGQHRSKLVYERPSPTAWRRTQYVSEDAGATWSVLWVDDLERAAREP